MEIKLFSFAGIVHTIINNLIVVGVIASAMFVNVYVLGNDPTQDHYYDRYKSSKIR